MSFPLYVFLGIAAIILATGISKAIQARAARGTAPDGALDAFGERLTAMERRLGDIQEIVLAADEKLERLEGHLATKALPD